MSFEHVAKGHPLLVAEPDGNYRSATAIEVLRVAEEVLLGRVRTGPMLTSAREVKKYLQVRMGALPHEEFHVLYLDSRHRLLHVEALFRGTLAQTSVYPREVVTQALKHEAAAVIFAHNHPSGSAVPSRADHVLTQTLKTALELVDIRVLDHVVVTVGECVSMAEEGWV